MSNIPCLEVVSPGLLTTLQDPGRADYTDLGLPVSGAVDPLALRRANLLAGNDPAAPALEITIAGPELKALQTCAVALAGADLDARIDGFTPLKPNACYLLRAGATLQFGAPRNGARAYLALAGGIAAPQVLGSSATYLAGGIGGLAGTGLPLRPGDQLAQATPADPLRYAGRIWPRALPPFGNTVRVLPGPHGEYFTPAALAQLCAGDWTVSDKSDRMGLRLNGNPLDRKPGELLSQGIVRGAIQAPPDGLPIVLLADHQTTGGYPVIGVVASADWSPLGQIAPGGRLRFSEITIEEAQRLLREQARELAADAAQLDLQGIDGGVDWGDVAGWSGDGVTTLTPDPSVSS